jgi:rhamnulokinase
VTERLVAVDLGASSGRVYVGDVGVDHFTLGEVGRFANGAVQIGDRLYWDILGLYRGILDNLTRANQEVPISSIGIDSWAVDYGLIRGDGTLISNPACYRDSRTSASILRAESLIGRDELFKRTGIAVQPFNTVFQLMSEQSDGHLSEASHVLLIPDLLNYFLTGELATELTNASTTQLLTSDGRWDKDLFNALEMSPSLFPRLVSSGNVLGELRQSVLSQIGASTAIQVVNVASHDTASAVLAVPASTSNFAYISCGTWSLVGTELESPIVNDMARLHQFSNERGVEGTFRLLHNVMGLWLLQESMREWNLSGESLDVHQLVLRSASELPLRSVIDINDESFLAPGDMPARIVDFCRRTQEPIPETPEQVTRCIIDSLALAYRDAIHNLEGLSGETFDVIHLVGGGVHNRLLCQLTADACGVTVIAGPVEAAAIGNILVQTLARGTLEGDRWTLREYVARNMELATYVPVDAMTKRFALRSLTSLR